MRKDIGRIICLGLMILPVALMSAPEELSQYWQDAGGEYAFAKAVNFTGKNVQSAESALLEDEQFAKLPDGSELTLDFGVVTGGFFEFKVNLAKPAKIRISYSEASAFARGQKDWLSSLSRSYRELLQRTYEVKQSGWFQDPVQMGGARYVKIEVLSGQIEIDAVRCKKTFFQCDPNTQGWFLSSDEQLNKIWYAGYYTVCLDTIPSEQGGKNSKTKIGEGHWVIVDGAKRDRLVWSGDLAIANRVVYVSNARYDFAKDSLMSLAKWQFDNGLYPAVSRAELGEKVAGDFLEYSIWQVINIYDYYLYSGDREFIKELYPSIIKAMNYHDLKTDNNGIFEQPFLRGGMNYSYSIIRSGPLAYTNALYYIALMDSAKIALDLGDIGQAQVFLTRADRIKNYFNQYFWDKKNSAYLDRKRDLSHHPLDGNSFAILSGLADRAKAEQVLDFFNQALKLKWGDQQFDKPYHFPRKIPLADGHNAKYVMPFINAFDALARYNLGRDDEALDLIKRCWGNMIDQDPNFTVWEWIGPKGTPDRPTTSLAHAWSAGATFILSEWVLGVRPIQPGFSQYVIEPHPSGIKWAKGAVPSPRGLIEVSWKDSADRFEIAVNTPSGDGPSLKLPTKGEQIKISLNDNLVYDNQTKIPNPTVMSLSISAKVVEIELKDGGNYQIIIEKNSEVRQ